MNKTLQNAINTYNNQLDELISDIEKLKISASSLDVRELQDLKLTLTHTLNGKKQPNKIKQSLNKVYDIYTCELEQLVRQNTKNTTTSHLKGGYGAGTDSGSIF